VNYIENILNDAYLSQNPFIFVLSKSLSELFSKLAFKIMPDEIQTGFEVKKICLCSLLSLVPKLWYRVAFWMYPK